MLEMKLHYFTKEENFPLYIDFGEHHEDLEQHLHLDFSELVLVVQGSALHQIESECYEIGPGDVFVINDGTSHGFLHPKNFHIINIMYRPEQLLRQDWDLSKSMGYHALFLLEPYFAKEYKFRSRLKLTPGDFESIASLCQRLMSAYQIKTTGRVTLCHALFAELLVSLSRLYEEQTIQEKGKNKLPLFSLAKTISYIQNHYQSPLSVEDLAKMAHYSKRHFIRIFREMYQVTPLDYILTLRIQYACHLLVTTRSSIQKISIDCGFTDGNYFSRLFQKRMGLSPREYRKQHSHSITSSK